MGLDPNSKKGATNNTPAGYPFLNKYENGPARKSSWKYLGIIGMIVYLHVTTHTDIAMATHQCAIFNNDTHLSHEQSVKRIGICILDTRDKGMIYRPDTLKYLECYVDTDFAVK